MKTTRKLSRRSFLGTVAGGIAAGGALVVLGGTAGAVQRTDNDSGPRADPAGRGTRTGLTDSDTGPRADPAGRGTRTGVTDSDPSDAPQRGRGRRACSDSDPGDPVGRGRRC